MKKGTIYIIRNKINSKVYIGQTTQKVEERFKQHLRCLKTNSKQLLFKAINKYGKNNFYFEILKECNISELNYYEEYYISKFDSYLNGYNLCKGGNQSRRRELNLPNIDIINLYNNGKSQRDIGEIYNVSHKTIGKILKKNNVNIRTCSIKLIKHNKISKEKLIILLQEGKTTKEIAEYFNVDKSSVLKFKRKHLKNIIFQESSTS